MDCQLSFQITQGVNFVAATTGQDDLAFDDPYHPEKDCDNPLNRQIPVWPKPEGQQCETDRTALLDRETENDGPRVWDCDAGKQGRPSVDDPTADEDSRGALGSIAVADPSNALGEDLLDDGADNTTYVNLSDEDGTLLWVPAATPRAGNLTGGSWYDLGNDTWNAANSCWGPERAVSTNESEDPFRATFEDDFYNLIGGRGPDEDEFGATNRGDGKRVADFALEWLDDNGNLVWDKRDNDPDTSAACANAVKGTVENATGDRCDRLGPSVDGTIDNDTPQDFGVRPISAAIGYGWSNGIFYLPPTYLGPTVRESDFQPASQLWFTFYAKVGKNTTDLGVRVPAVVAGTYGVEACPSGAGDYKGPSNWDCNPARWWEGTPGGLSWETFGGHGERILPHTSKYHARDVDCYDGSLLRGAPVYAGLTLASDEPPCPVV